MDVLEITECYFSFLGCCCHYWTHFFLAMCVQKVTYKGWLWSKIKTVYIGVDIYIGLTIHSNSDSKCS